MKIWIARHGNRLDFVYPEWFNTAKRRYDPPLSEDGFLQAQKLAKRLQLEEINHLFVSPFLRTIQTAYPLAERLNLPLKIEAGFSEWFNPNWMTATPETHPIDWLKANYPLIDETYQSKVIPQYPEGETELYHRIGYTIRQLIAEFSNTILIVGHSASMLGITQQLIGQETEIKTPLGGIVTLEQQAQKWTLILNGETEHLK